MESGEEVVGDDLCLAGRPMLHGKFNLGERHHRRACVFSGISRENHPPLFSSKRHLARQLDNLLLHPLRLGFQAGDLLLQFFSLRGNDLHDHRLVLLRSFDDLVITAGAWIVQRFDHLQNPRLEVFVE
jgi:hypothetical protein